MAKITEISYTRITLALDIIRKINSGDLAGYHELGIVKHLVNLGDTITVEDSENMSIVCTHPKVPEDERNICWEAVDLIKKEFSVNKSVKITIDKRIPVEGGLAGGSTNGATVIKILNDLWGLSLSTSKMMALGKKLGMDVPFYFYGGTAFDSEAGGELEMLENSCGKLYFALVIPSFGVSTKDAYGNIGYGNIAHNVESTQRMIEALKCGDIKGVAENIHNDFENSVFHSNPKLGEIKSVLLELGAKAAFMTGSGSTMVGLLASRKGFEAILKRFPSAIFVESI